MAVGELKRDKRKTRKRAGWADRSSGNVLHPHKGTITFAVHRTYGQRGGDYPRQGDYTATACVRAGGAFKYGRANRCARATGATPTKAIRRAVSILASKIK